MHFEVIVSGFPHLPFMFLTGYYNNGEKLVYFVCYLESQHGYQIQSIKNILLESFIFSENIFIYLHIKSFHFQYFILMLLIYPCIPETNS